MRMKAPAGCTSINFGGDVIEVVDGFATIPQELVADATSHGFVVAPEGDTLSDIDLAAEAKFAEVKRSRRKKGAPDAPADGEQSKQSGEQPQAEAQPEQPQQVEQALDGGEQPQA
jgi:hypothetical protein